MIGTSLAWRTRAAHVEALHAGEPQIDQQQIGRVGRKALQPLLAVRGFDDLESLVLEQQTQHLPDRGFVFDHEQSVGHRRP